MKKIFTLCAALLLCAAMWAGDLYLRGDVNSWGATDEWKFVDGVLEKSFELTGSFKIADSSWAEQYGDDGENATIGSIKIKSGGNNISCNGKKFNVTKMTINTSEGTLAIEGTEVSNNFDVTKDYGIIFHQYCDAGDPSSAMTFKGNGVYEVTATLVQQQYGCKFADNNYNPINFGTNGTNADITKSYAPKNGASNNIWFDTEAATPSWGSEYVVTLTVDTNWNATCTFELNEQPQYTYDTVMYVAGNFTNWAAGMHALPYAVTLPKDSTLEFKQVRVVTKKQEAEVVGKDTTWYGQTGDGFMTRESNTWTLDGANNVKLLTDAAGEYTFSLVGESFVVTFPEQPTPPCVDNFGLMVDGTYVPGVYNETSSEWTVLNQDLKEGQILSMYSYCGETSFAPKQGNYADYFDVTGDTMIVKEAAEYDFYIQLIEGNDKLWVVQRKTVVLPRITKAPVSWAGEYAITAMVNDSVAAVWTGVDAGQSRDSIKLTDGKLAAVDPIMVVVEEMNGGGYSVKVKGGTNDGKYITQAATPAYGNGLKFVDKPVRVDITMNGGLVDFYQTISSTQTVYLLYNKTKGKDGERFRFYKGNNYGGSNYMSLTLFGTPAPAKTYDTIYTIAGNFTGWAEGMQPMPYEVENVAVDSVLEYKVVRELITYLDSVEIQRDTTWLGQVGDGSMTRTSNAWKLDGQNNVKLTADREGTYTFSFNAADSVLTVAFPALPGYTYDTVYTIAGNFTGWAEGMQPMPYEVKNVAIDSILEYKVVRQLITYETGVEVRRDTTWLGQPNSEFMTRENNAWKLDGANNVKLQADEQGTYIFEFSKADSVLTVTFPEILPRLDSVNTIANIKACYKAKTLADNDSVVVKGYITKISVKPSNFAKYGSANIWITDTLGGKTDELELYNCYGLEKDTFVYFGPNYTKTGSAFIDVDTLIDRNGVRYVVGEYLESAGKFKYFSGTYELNQGCYLTKGGTAPQPAPKYYITGNAALVGELAWNPTALLMVDSTHTFMGMAANSYEMKITNGAWDPEGHSWGFGDLDTEASSDGLTEGENGNICFTVEIPNNVVVSFANGKITVTGDFKKGPGTALDALMINSQKNGKFIYNGQLIIRQNGVLYNAAGERLK